MRINIIKSYSPRLEVNYTLINNGIAGIPKSEILTWSSQNKIPLGEANVFVRITTHVMSDINQEIIGYIYEHIGNYSPTSLDNDYKSLSNFVSEAFMNHRYNYEQNVNNSISQHVLIPRPPEKEITEKLIMHLKEEGFYL